MRESVMHTEFWWGNLKERHDLEDLGVDGRVILKWLKGEEWDDDWIHLAEDIDKLWVFVHTVTNLLVP
jgi:hypothetical protein